MNFLGNLFNPSAANVPLPSYVSPQAFGATLPTQTTQAPGGNIDPNAVAGQYYGGVGNLGGYNTFGQLLPQAMGIGQGMINDPSAGMALGGAYTGAGYGAGGAANAYGAGGNLYGMMGPIMQQAFDPQSALYQQLYGQTQQQSLANLSNAGLATSPYGQGVLGNTLNNFNINWQNAQLQRMLSGANTLNTLAPTAAQLQAGAVPLAAQSAALPWMQGQQIGGANLGTLNTLGGFGTSAAQLPQQQLQDYMSLMGWGTGAQQQAFNQNQLANFVDPSQLAASANAFNQQLFSDQMTQQQVAQAQQQAAMSGLGSLAGAGLGFGFGGLGGMMGMMGHSPFGGGQPGTGGAAGSPLGLGGLPSTWTQPFAGLFNRQFGGSTNPGQTLTVGEEGPEQVVFDRPGTIIPNPQTQSRMGDGPSFGLPTEMGASGMGMPMPPPGAMQPMGGIGAMSRGFQRPPSGMGWQFGGGFGV